MHEFVAIDFETANQNRDSACAVGLVVVRDGKIVKTFKSLIRPPTMEFSHWNTAIHRIKPTDVAGKPSFARIWPDIYDCMQGLPVVAHNAAFDMSVLHACIMTHGIAQFNLKWLCTLELSRCLLPGLPNHKLGTLATLFGLQLKHHDAADDARVCAEIAIRLCRLIPSDELPSFFRHHVSQNVVEGEPDDFMHDSDGLNIELPTAIDLVASAKPDGRFLGIRFAFTGELNHMTREQAVYEVIAQGGEVSESISKKTDYLVAGGNILEDGLQIDTGSTKFKKAQLLQSQGAKVQIIDESTFLGMLRK